MLVTERIFLYRWSDW